MGHIPARNSGEGWVVPGKRTRLGVGRSFTCLLCLCSQPRQRLWSAQDDSEPNCPSFRWIHQTVVRHSSKGHQHRAVEEGSSGHAPVLHLLSAAPPAAISPHIRLNLYANPPSFILAPFGKDKLSIITVIALITWRKWHLYGTNNQRLRL